MKPLLPLLALSLLLTGCGIMPKNVEYFQDRVEPVPEMGKKENETLKQAAKMAARKAKETELAAVSTGADASVKIPARDTSVLTEAVSDRVGPPLRDWRDDRIDELVALMEKQQARHSQEMEEYRENNQVNVGKAIEGTGRIQLGYFTNLLFVFVFLCILLILYKVVTGILKVSNPAAGVIIGGVETGVATLGKGVGEMISAGQAFKDKLSVIVPEKAEELRKVFNETQKEYQSRETQQLVQRAKGK